MAAIYSMCNIKKNFKKMLTQTLYASIINLLLETATTCGSGGTGRRARLRGVWATVRVQVPSSAPKQRALL